MGSGDWGGQPSNFVQFDNSLDLIIEKTTRLAKFLSERAQAKIDYSKKLKEISLKHQQKYNSYDFWVKKYYFWGLLLAEKSAIKFR